MYFINIDFNDLAANNVMLSYQCHMVNTTFQTSMELRCINNDGNSVWQKF